MRGEAELSSFVDPHYSFLQVYQDLGNMRREKRRWDEAEASQQKCTSNSEKKLLRATTTAKMCITFHYVPKGQASKILKESKSSYYVSAP